MTVRLYRSSDASAPVLTGLVGTLVALLDACLVNGYGATAAAGWTKAFAGANQAAYRMATSGNTGFYLNVNDNGPSAATGKEARVRGYETMSALDTGTGLFPTVAQNANGGFVRKSITADATIRQWTLIADGSCLYLFLDSGDNAAPVGSTTLMFGDIFSYKAGDDYRCALIARYYENTGSYASANLSQLLTSSLNPMTQSQVNSWIARSHTGAGTSLAFARITSPLVGYDAVEPRAIGGPGSQVTYPNGPDGSLLLAPIWIGHASAVRGYFKGLWAPLHYQPLGHGDTFSGVGEFAGKTFIALNVVCGNNTQLNGQLVVETSNTWS